MAGSHQLGAAAVHRDDGFAKFTGRGGDSRIWRTSDFVNNKMPVQLDGVSVTVNGQPAYVYYISPTQVNILTPPATLSGLAPVRVTNNGAMTTPALADFLGVEQP